MRCINSLVVRIIGTTRREVRLFKPAVKDQFGIDATVSRTVDIFEEYTIHHRGDFGFFLRNINIDTSQGNFLRRCSRDKPCDS